MGHDRKVHLALCKSLDYFPLADRPFDHRRCILLDWRQPNPQFAWFSINPDHRAKLANISKYVSKSTITNTFDCYRKGDYKLGYTLKLVEEKDAGETTAGANRPICRWVKKSAADLWSGHFIAYAVKDDEVTDIDTTAWPALIDYFRWESNRNEDWYGLKERNN